MKIRHTLVFAFIIASSMLCKAQEHSLPNFHMDLVLKDGYFAYSKKIAYNLRYSYQTKVKGTKGIILLKFQNKVGEGIQSEVLTYLDEYVEKNVNDILPMLTEQWVSIEEPYTAYIAVTYNIDYYYYETLAASLEEMPETFKSNMSGKVNVIGLNSFDQMANEKSNDPIILEEYEKLNADLEKNLKKGKNKKAYSALNQIIALNPFNQKLIRQRQELETQLGFNQYSAYDTRLLEALPHLNSYFNE